EQQRADAASVHVVGHGEGDLGRALPGDLIGPDAYQLTTPQREQRRVIGRWHAADPPGLTLAGQLADAEEPPVLIIGRHGLVHRLDQAEISWRGGPYLDCRAVGQPRGRAGAAASPQPVPRFTDPRGPPARP